MTRPGVGQKSSGAVKTLNNCEQFERRQPRASAWVTSARQNLPGHLQPAVLTLDN